MFVRKLHKAFAIFLMALLISAKFAAYHSLSHEDDCVECCSFCENVMVIGQTPALAAEADVYDDFLLLIPSREVVSIAEDISFYPQIPSSSLFSRPPPAV